MTTTGDVQITIVDNNANIVIPGTSIQAVLGCAIGGTDNAIVSTRSPTTLKSTFSGGPLMQAAAQVCLAGGTVLAVKVPTTTKGASGALTAASGNTSTSAVTVTDDATDGVWGEFYWVFKVVAGGTVGTTGITFQLSLDAGRTFGPVISLGIASSYAVPETGETIDFAAGDLVAGDSWTWHSTGPSWAIADVNTALQALQASSFAIVGWGGDTQLIGDLSGADCSTLQGYLNTLATADLFTRVLAHARDVSPAAKWDGTTGETEAAWMTSLETDYAAVAASRVCVSAGWYNMPSAYTNSAAGTPRLRTPLSVALACRQVQIPPQRHAGRVRDGSLSQIVVDSLNDGTDGFVYHDERINPGLDAARFCAARTRLRKQGFYIDNPNLMSATGSDYDILPKGNVMDVASGITVDVGQTEIDSDLRLNTDGTIYVNDALSIQNEIKAALDEQMTAAQMISAATVFVDPTQNVGATSKVTVSVGLTARGYVLELDVSLSYTNSLAA